MVTIKDIAAAAGTSLSTVSRVLNGTVIRDEALADRIKKIAEEMNYQPNVAGRQLRLGGDDEFGPAFDVRSQQGLHAKQLIAKAATQFVSSSDVIVLDSGSTVAQVATYLPANTIVYTNSLAVLQPAAKRGVHVHLAPGLYVPAMAAVFGRDTEEYFRRHRCNVYFLSSARVDVKTGLYNLNSSTFSVKQTVLEQAGKRILLVGHEKFCDAGLDSYAPLSVVDVIVTDFVPEPFRETLMQTGVQVIEVDRDLPPQVLEGDD